MLSTRRFDAIPEWHIGRVLYVGRYQIICSLAEFGFAVITCCYGARTSYVKMSLVAELSRVLRCWLWPSSGQTICGSKTNWRALSYPRKSGDIQCAFGQQCSSMSCLLKVLVEVAIDCWRYCTGSGFVRASSPPCGDCCPQAFSRLQDSRFYHTINHYQNVRSWPTRHVLSCRYKLVNNDLEKKHMPRAAASVKYQHNLRKYLPSYSSISTWISQRMSTRPSHLDLRITSLARTQIQRRLDHSTTLLRKSMSVTVCSLQ